MKRQAFLYALAAAMAAGVPTLAFVPSSSMMIHPQTSLFFNTRSKNAVVDKRLLSSPWCHTTCEQPSSSTTKLQMSFNDDDDGPSFVTTVVGVIFVLLFVGSSLLPIFDMAQQGRDMTDLSIADSVVTRQDAPGKLKGFESKYDSLSRAAIQEKLNAIPVFYTVDEHGSLGSNIYLSYADALSTVTGSSSSTVKATTLDQVMYPLILKRGRMRMAPPPQEVSQAEEVLRDEGSEPKTYQLIPSSKAQNDADELGLTLPSGDIPLYIADKLAFAGPKGPQVPLFLEKADAVTSYNRLRESSGNKLPAQPNIRTATLLDQLSSMEKGTRPGVSQLVFYGAVEDLLKASEMIQ
mmetsp:Transcript_17286/g.26743  ORF Transcript_17286/g.26743 Transcript_17286/m.26743 type:complete len:350 (-) Transcript_17286:194-1243(-)